MIVTAIKAYGDILTILKIHIYLVILKHIMQVLTFGGMFLLVTRFYNILQSILMAHGCVKAI